MLNKIIIASALVVGLSACTSKPYDYSQPPKPANYSKPANIYPPFQVQNAGTQALSVQRDSKLCATDKLDKQNCPTYFYINDHKVADFYVNNMSSFYVKPATYTLKVRNCNTGKCLVDEVKICVNEGLSDNKLVLSLDSNDRPVISHSSGSKNINCEPTKPLPPPPPEYINLAADTLFKFDKFKAEDLLPAGRAKLDEVANVIRNGYVSVNSIELIGHTDRLGSEQYNYTLGMNRAKTVHEYLATRGVPAHLLSHSSSGKSQPVTNGCQGVTPRAKLIECLQPDRRVTVAISGVKKVQ
jgi:OmpA-OmpF porin, OOP family